MSGFGTGLDAQFGMAEETTVGTLETVDHFYEFSASDMALDPTYIESDGIRAGSKFRRAAQAGIAKVAASGSVTLPYTYKQMAFLWRHALGAPLTQGANPGATPTVKTGTAYESILVPGGLQGISASIQVGKPEPSSGTVYPFDYNGCKVTDWSLTVEDGAEVQFKLSFDGWNEDTSGSLATASFVASNTNWLFKNCSVFKFGGTASTTSGLMSIAGGSSVTAIVTSLTLSGTNKFANDRYGLGNAGVKAEQLENDFCEITGEFTAELHMTELYAPFAAGTQTAIEVGLVGDEIDTTGEYNTSNFIIPAAKFTEGSAEVSGPDIVQVKGSFKAYDDGTNAPFQVHVISEDTAL